MRKNANVNEYGANAWIDSILNNFLFKSLVAFYFSFELKWQGIKKTNKN